MDVSNLSKETRRKLAIQKLAKLFGKERQNEQDPSNAERHILQEVLRKTNQREIALLVQSRLHVLKVDSASDDESEDSTHPCLNNESRDQEAPASSPRDTLRTVDKLRAIVKQNLKPQAELLEASFWEAISGGLLTARGGYVHGNVRGVEALPPARAADLHSPGYLRVQAGRASWRERGVQLEALSDVMRKLRHSGWPPVFVYMFDDAWRLLDSLFEVGCSLLGGELHNNKNNNNDIESTTTNNNNSSMNNSANEALGEVVLEPSFFAWALCAGGSSGRTVGNNFGLPHRDYSYTESWSNTTPARPRLVCLWVPTVDADPDNGCLHVLPREFDEHWDRPQHPSHQLPATALDGAPGITEVRFPLGGLRPLQAEAGTVLAWAGNTIHMGSACSSAAGHRPRSSMACTFRRPDCGRLCGAVLPNLTRTDARNLTLEGRFRLICQSLLLYSQWYTLPKDIPLP